MDILCAWALNVEIFFFLFSLFKRKWDVWLVVGWRSERGSLKHQRVIASNLSANNPAEQTDEKRNNFSENIGKQQKQKGGMKNIFNFLRFAHKYQKLIIRAASSMKRRSEFHLPFCHHIHPKAPIYIANMAKYIDMWAELAHQRTHAAVKNNKQKSKKGFNFIVFLRFVL